MTRPSQPRPYSSALVSKPMFAACILLLAAVPTLMGCKPNTVAKQKSLESKDWFRSGKDRFYLAQLRTNGMLPGTNMPKGSEVVVGIGCVGEDDNWKAPDPRKPSRGLHQRQYYNPIDQTLSDFPLGDTEHLKKGECAVLLGNQQGAVDFIKRTKESDNSLLTKGLTAVNYGFTAWSMWSCASNVGMIAAVVGTGGAATPGVIATMAMNNSSYSVAKKMKDAAANGAKIVQKTVKKTAASGASSLHTSNVVINAGLTAAGLQDPLSSILFAGTTLLGGFASCGDAALMLGMNVQEQKKQSNRLVFMDHFAGAMDYAQVAAAQKYPDFAAFAKGANSGNKAPPSPQQQVKFLAQLNSVAVPYFNGDDRAYGQFEQGWFGAQDFFKEIKEINKEMTEAQKESEAQRQEEAQHDQEQMQE